MCLVGSLIPGFVAAGRRSAGDGLPIGQFVQAFGGNQLAGSETADDFQLVAVASTDMDSGSPQSPILGQVYDPSLGGGVREARCIGNPDGRRRTRCLLARRLRQKRN